MDCSVQGTGIVSHPQISPELYLKEDKKKKSLYIPGFLNISQWMVP